MTHLPAKIVATVTIGFLGVFAPSVADAAPVVEQIEPTDTLASLELSATMVTLLISLIIPVIVGLVTKADLPSQWKGLASLVLNLVSAGIVNATVSDGTAVWSTETLTVALIAAAISVTTYLGIYKPIDLNARLAPDKGL